MEYFTITENKKKTSELLYECRALFPVWSYYDNDTLDKEFPTPKKLTTRYFKKTVEADENWASVSADDLKDKGIEGITLRERILMESQYFKETGNHLDISNITLCAGSRFADGRVPYAYWDDGMFFVYWSDSSGRYSSLRVREAFSSDPSLILPSDPSLPDTITINGAKYKRYD